MVAEKETMTELEALQPETDSAQTLLDDLTSASKVAIWRLMFWVVAVSIWIHESLWDVFRDEINAIAEATIAGTSQWYRNQCLLFQYGDDLEYNTTTYKFEYSTKEANKQTIKRASVQEFGGDLLIKVAKEVSGSIEPLDTDEYNAFSAYMNQIKFAGTFLNIISQDADLINITIQVYYDPKILNSSGQLLSDTSVKPVEDAIAGYLDDLPWNGIYRNTSLVDAVQQAAGVTDVVLGTVQAKAYNAATYGTVTRTYQTVAGHIQLNTLTTSYHV